MKVSLVSKKHCHRCVIALFKSVIHALLQVKLKVELQDYYHLVCLFLPCCIHVKTFHTAVFVLRGFELNTRVDENDNELIIVLYHEKTSAETFSAMCFSHIICLPVSRAGKISFFIS